MSILAQNTHLYTVAEASLSNEWEGRNAERQLLLNVTLIIKRGMLSQPLCPIPPPNFGPLTLPMPLINSLVHCLYGIVGPDVLYTTFIQT